MNNVILTGRLVDEPKVQTFGDDLKKATLTLAVQLDFKDNEGNYVTEFIDCVAWRAKAELIEKYLSKGRKVLVGGTLRIDKWDDDRYVNDEGEPVRRTKAYVDIQNIEFLDSKKDTDNAEENDQPQKPQAKKQQSTKKVIPWD